MGLTAGPDVLTKTGTATLTYNRTAAPLHPPSLLAQLPRSIQKFRTLRAEICLGSYRDISILISGYS